MKEKKVRKQPKYERPFTPQQERFCIAYTTPGYCAGVAYKSYAYAYDLEIPQTPDGKPDPASKEYKVAQASGSRLLLVPKIQRRIKDLYLQYLNDQDIDARLAEIVKLGRDTDAIQGIKVYNDLKQRVTKKLDVTSAGRPLVGLSDDELREMLGE